MKRTVGAILFVIYSIIAITVTVLLLSYNDYNCSEIGGNTVYIVNDDALEPEYDEGSILIIEETSDKNVQVGDKLFLYKVINSQEFEVVTRTLENKVQQGNHTVYQVENGENYDTTYFIGKADDATVIGSPWGTLLSILESKWGYLFCIVVVSLLLFLQEVFDLVIELKYGGTKGTKSANIAHARKTANKAPAKKTTATKTTATKTKGAKVATAKASSAKTSASAKATSARTTAKKIAKTVETVAEANNTNAETVEEEG